MTYRIRINQETATGAIGPQVYSKSKVSEGNYAKVKALLSVTSAPVVTSEAGVIAAALGPTISAAQLRARGPSSARYVDDFMKFNEIHHAGDGVGWEKAYYYDRAKLFYAWWTMTGNAVYRSRANALLTNYRDVYVPLGPSAHWSFPEGLAIHYLLTKDPKSAAALATIGKSLTVPYYLDAFDGNLNLDSETHGIDNRIRARMIQSLLSLRVCGLPSPMPESFLLALMNRLLASQLPSGEFTGTRMTQKSPFMTGLLHDAMSNYHDQVNPDPRIVPAIKRSLDHMWQHWRADAGAFVYDPGQADGGADDLNPAPDLNMLVVNGFGFVYKQTRNELYKTRGDAVFAGGVNGSWLEGSKQFNQQYANSCRYPVYVVS